jgi:hypothetical protein
MNQKLGIVITDGVGYRNFVLSDFLVHAGNQFEKVVVFSCLPKSAYQNLPSKVEVIELQVFEEAFATWFWRKAKEVAHLQLHRKNNFGIQDNWNANRSKRWTSRGIATRIIYAFTKFFHHEKHITCYEKKQQKTFDKHPLTQQYQTYLETHQINLLFFTHQRPPYIAPMVLAAKKAGITTATFIFSWDNLASKGRMAATFDHYLVWSNLMQSDLLHFYGQVSPKQVHVVGTPQFEPYVLKRYGYDAKTFYNKFGLDASLKTLLFSCGDVSTSPNDPWYIQTIANAIINGELPKLNLLVRTSPAETPERFAAIKKQYPWIRWNEPKWYLARAKHQETWSQRIPTEEDIHDLKSILQHTHVHINMLSTMSLDGMLFQKPMINPVFGNASNGLGNDQRYLQYAHIEYLVNSKAIYLAKKETELIEAINQALTFPNEKSNQQKELLNLQLGAPLEGTSQRIATVLAKWI